MSTCLRPFLSLLSTYLVPGGTRSEVPNDNPDLFFSPCIHSFDLSLFHTLRSMGPDVEKNHGSPSVRSESQDERGPEDHHSTASIHKSKYERWAENINGLEVRGIEPVPLEERQKPTAWASLEMLLMWFSMGMAVNNIIAGSLGTLILKLSYKDAVICAIFGNLLGNLAVGYMSTYGPRSGNRTLV